MSNVQPVNNFTPLQMSTGVMAKQKPWRLYIKKNNYWVLSRYSCMLMSQIFFDISFSFGPRQQALNWSQLPESTSKTWRHTCVVWAIIYFARVKFPQYELYLYRQWVRFSVTHQKNLAQIPPLFIFADFCLKLWWTRYLNAETRKSAHTADGALHCYTTFPNVPAKALWPKQRFIGFFSRRVGGGSVNWLAIWRLLWNIMFLPCYL